LTVFQGNEYLDDRLFIVEVRRSIVERRGARWTVVTRRNTRKRPPTRTDDFATRQEAVAYLEEVEPHTPRISLDGEAPDPVPSLKEHRAWLRSIGVASAYVEPEPKDDGSVYELYTGARLQALSDPHDWMKYLSWGYEMTSVNVSPAGRDALNWRVGGFTTPFRMAQLFDQVAETVWRPWALIVYDRPYRLMGHFLSTRGSQAAMVGGSHTAGQELPDDLTNILVSSPKALSDAATRSPLYQDAWNLLSAAPSDRPWLCLPPSLPTDWVNGTEAQDADLLAQERKKVTPVT
jgi:hypothetical protein